MIRETEIRGKLEKAIEDRARMEAEVQQLIQQQTALRERAMKLRNDLIACNGVIAALTEVLGGQSEED